MNARIWEKIKEDVQDYGGGHAEWKDVGGVFESKDEIISGLLKEMVDQLSEKEAGVRTLMIFQCVTPSGDPGEELALAHASVQDEFLKQLEKEGIIEGFRTENHAHEQETGTDLQYAVFECDAQRALPALYEEIKKTNRILAGKTRKEKSDSKFPFRVTYEPIDGRIVVNAYGNGYVLSKPQYGSPSQRLFEYVYSLPEKKIAKEDLKKYGGYKPTQTMQPKHNVYDLGFKGELKKLFFSHVEKNSITFHDRVSKSDLKNIKIDEEKLQKQLENLAPIKLSKKK